jgi:nitrite reductase/ring-hydroxylating ferredoxin subunit
MKLVTISRREVCAGIAAAVVAGCGGSSTESADAPPDTGSGSGSGSGGACATAATDVGAPAMFAMNQPVYFSSGNFFVVRDANGLYALTARCTHQGVTCVAETADFFCPAHGSMFDFDGNVTHGPASVPLQHYAMCLLANGHVGVDTAMKVTQATRLSA